MRTNPRRTSRYLFKSGHLSTTGGANCRRRYGRGGEILNVQRSIGGVCVTGKKAENSVFTRETGTAVPGFSRNLDEGLLRGRSGEDGLSALSA